VAGVTGIAASVIDISAAERVPPGQGLFPDSRPGKAEVMRQSDHRTRMDDESSTRPEDDEPRVERAQVIRLLANPRRVRRA
jgi:hypothetical protein